MACTHQWYVTGTDFPVIRCGLCGSSWIGVTVSQAFNNLDAYEVLKDAILGAEYARHEPDTRALHLQRADTIWQLWTKKRMPKITVNGESGESDE